LSWKNKMTAQEYGTFPPIWAGNVWLLNSLFMYTNKNVLLFFILVSSWASRKYHFLGDL
jgi:hypothetical protein